MHVYRTLAGQRIPLVHLPVASARLAHELVKIREDIEALGRGVLRASGKGKANDEPATVGAYRQKAWDVIQRYTRTRRQLLQILTGPVGQVYVDGVHRLRYALLTRKAERATFRRRLRYHPIRLLYDRYLTSGLNQLEFASLAGLDPAVISRVFSLLRKPGTTEDNGISLSELTRAFRELNITAVPVQTDQDEPNTEDEDADMTPFETSGQMLTPREIQLLGTAVFACYILWHSPFEPPDSNRNVILAKAIALPLGAIYGIEDPTTLHALVTAFLDLLKEPNAVQVNTSEGLKSATLNCLAQFQLGIAEGGVIFVPVASDVLNVGDEPRLADDYSSQHPANVSREYLKAMKRTWAGLVDVFRSWSDNLQSSMNDLSEVNLCWGTQGGESGSCDSRVGQGSDPSPGQGRSRQTTTSWGFLLKE